MFEVRQESDYALSLQRRAKSGEVAPAAFQRPYVWTAVEVEALWESIMMGLPIGSFVLWQPPGGAKASRMLGPISLEPSAHAALILDGQNRLATLAWSGTDPKEEISPEAAGYELWRSGRRLVADAHASRVRFADANEVNPWLVPMHVIGNGLQSYLRKAWDGTEEQLSKVDWLENVEYRLRSARIIVTTIQADEADARRAYYLMATGGVPISPEDFDAALAGSRQNG